MSSLFVKGVLAAALALGAINSFAQSKSGVQCTSDQCSCTSGSDGCCGTTTCSLSGTTCTCT